MSDMYQDEVLAKSRVFIVQVISILRGLKGWVPSLRFAKTAVSIYIAHLPLWSSAGGWRSSRCCLCGWCHWRRYCPTWSYCWSGCCHVFGEPSRTFWLVGVANASITVCFTLAILIFFFTSRCVFSSNRCCFYILARDTLFDADTQRINNGITDRTVLSIRGKALVIWLCSRP